LLKASEGRTKRKAKRIINTAEGGRNFFFNMQIKIINIPLTDDGSMQAELNRVLASHRILEVEQRFFKNEKGGCWSFCIRYIVQATAMSTQCSTSKEKIDYKQVLSESDFITFSVLREIRKQIATEDAVPAYAVFTDEELSNIAKLPQLEASKLASIKGIGEKKVQKYGKQMVDMYYEKTHPKDETDKLFT
jgi:superfamily II DNA helicase RecQ